MGLDMYLKASFFVSDYRFDETSESVRFNNVLKAVGLVRSDVSQHSPHMDVQVTVAYWRKANAVHKWFVDKIQDGRDECQTSYVSRENLEALVKDCEEVLAARKKRKKPDKLKPQPGFFFGSTEMDEGYYQDLEDTVKQVRAVLDNPKFENAEFYYRASW